MALRKKDQLDQPDDNKSINLYCPQLKCKGTVNVLKCLFMCPKSRVLKCEAYTEVYPRLLNFEVEDKYIEKYGNVTIVVPVAFRKRRKRRELVT